MNIQETTDFIRRFFSHPLSNDLKMRFGSWLISNHLKDEKNQAMHTIWEEITAEADAGTIEDLAELHEQINQTPKTRFILNHWKQVAAAVTLLLIGSFTSYLFFHTPIEHTETKMLQCFTPNGQRKSVHLPDGSIAWLNSGSLLIYPDNFNSDTRTIYLTGEAEFSVKKNHKKPFIVKTNYIDVQALGTVFTVTSYPGDSTTKAMLEEGSIKIDITKNSGENHILSPNELLTYSNSTGRVTIRSIDAKQVARWKEGYLIFHTATLPEIFRDIERRHNVEIYYDRQKIGTGIYNVKFMPDETVEENMEVLKELINGFDYKIKGKIIYIN